MIIKNKISLKIMSKLVFGLKFCFGILNFYYFCLSEVGKIKDGKMFHSILQKFVDKFSYVCNN